MEALNGSSYGDDVRQHKQIDESAKQAKDDKKKKKRKRDKGEETLTTTEVNAGPEN
jgi:hypothetical protein